jgi:hypothetical protein
LTAFGLDPLSFRKYVQTYLAALAHWFNHVFDMNYLIATLFPDVARIRPIS